MERWNSGLREWGIGGMMVPLDRSSEHAPVGYMYIYAETPQVRKHGASQTNRRKGVEELKEWKDGRVE